MLTDNHNTEPCSFAVKMRAADVSADFDNFGNELLIWSDAYSWDCKARAHKLGYLGIKDSIHGVR